MFSKRNSLKDYVLIFVASLIFDWLVQMSYFLYATSVNSSSFTGLRTLFEYKTGIIGDLILLPIINVLILFVIKRSKFKISSFTILSISLAALLSDAFISLMQGYLNLTNWSMPRPYDWNFAGRWHLFSLFVQLGYLYFFFYLIIRGWYKKDWRVKMAITSVSFLLIVFLMLFLYDYVFYFLENSSRVLISKYPHLRIPGY